MNYISVDQQVKTDELSLSDIEVSLDGLDRAANLYKLAMFSGY